VNIFNLAAAIRHHRLCLREMIRGISAILQEETEIDSRAGPLYQQQSGRLPDPGERQYRRDRGHSYCRGGSIITPLQIKVSAKLEK
jgi:hypothetical protein